jgi:hypothetical protein
MPDPTAIIKSIRSSCNKNSKAYKVTEYYSDLTTGILDDGRIAIATGKILNIERDLLKWIKKHPNNYSPIMQPEEKAIILIKDLRERGILSKNDYAS